MAIITQQSIWGQLRANADAAIFGVNDAGAPVNATTGAAICGPGSTYTDNVTGDKYLQTGTLASPVWTLMDSAKMPQQVSGTITAAQIISTAAGGLGHANGFIMVPAPVTGFSLILLQATIIYLFGVAAYTAGGNVTVNYGAGGAALSGLVSAANSLGAAVSKFLGFVPLSTAAIPLVDAAAINLVSSAAFTNPGTATGTIKYRVTYMLQPNT